jgi:hypothetical protein
MAAIPEDVEYSQIESPEGEWTEANLFSPAGDDIDDDDKNKVTWAEYFQTQFDDWYYYIQDYDTQYLKDLVVYFLDQYQFKISVILISNFSLGWVVNFPFTGGRLDVAVNYLHAVWK